jgi:hypothetical protein
MTTTLDAQAAFTGTVAPEGDDRLDETRLTQWFEQNVAGFVGPLSIAKFKGGQSNPTYRIDAPSGPYVLRRKPFGKLLPSAHAVDREYKVQAALSATGFPVAPQYGLCTDDSVIGSWFYVMGCVDGRTIWDGACPAPRPKAAARITRPWSIRWPPCTTSTSRGSALAISESPETISGGRWNAGPGNIACRKPKPWTRWSS